MLMKNHGFSKFAAVTGSDCLPRPTFVQQLHGFSRTHLFQTNPCQWPLPIGILLPTPKPLFVR